MKLTQKQLRKVRDSRTKETLEQASDDTPLRVVMTLKPEKNKQSVEEKAGSDPSLSRQEMRRRIIEQKTRGRRAALQPIIDELTAKRLDVKGGMLRTVVVDGLASDIVKGLDLTGVFKVQVDRKNK